MTLSTQVGVRKPDARIFRAALDKFDRTARFEEAIFITENTGHEPGRRPATSASAGLSPSRTGPAGHTDSRSLPELVPLVLRLLRRDD